MVDRRRGERRQGGGRAAEVERPASGGEHLTGPAQHPAFRLAQQGGWGRDLRGDRPGVRTLSQCGALLSVEMPRFTEPPGRLDLTVVHETIPPNRARHAVKMQSFSATGRVLLTSRQFARTLTESL